jgi:hypothetical protein
VKDILSDDPPADPRPAERASAAASPAGLPGVPSLAAFALPMSLGQLLADNAKSEAALVTDGMMALARCRTPVEFFLVQNRLVSEFLARSMQRAAGLAAAAPPESTPRR